MKNQRFPGMLPRFSRYGALLGLMMFGVTRQVEAVPVQVDTELLLLVDVSGSLTNPEFDLLMEAYGRAMTNASVLEAIQGGDSGRIAAAVVFFGGATNQTVGVQWMEISDLTSATAFQSAITAAVRPFMGRTAIGSAIAYGTPLFGTETGGAENGFSSRSQIVEISGDGVDTDTPTRGQDRGLNVRAAANQSLAGGVDVINGVAYNDANGKLTEYYNTYVVGGGVATDAGSTETATSLAAFEDALVRNLVAELRAGSTFSNTIQSVPEPSGLWLGLFASLMGFKRRR